MRIGMFLEIATTLGAVLGAYLATPRSHLGARHHLRRGAALLRLALQPRAHRRTGRTAARPPGATAAAQRQLSHARTAPRLQRPARPDGLRPDVRRRRALRPAGHRLGRAQGAGHGPGHAHALQGLHHHQQLHDRRHRRGQRGRVPQPRLHRPGAGHAGHLRGAGGRDAGGALPGRGPDRTPAAGLRRRGGAAGGADDLQRPDREASSDPQMGRPECREHHRQPAALGGAAGRPGGPDRRHLVSGPSIGTRLPTTAFSAASPPTCARSRALWRAPWPAGRAT